MKRLETTKTSRFGVHAFTFTTVFYLFIFPKIFPVGIQHMVYESGAYLIFSIPVEKHVHDQKLPRIITVFFLEESMNRPQRKPCIILRFSHVSIIDALLLLMSVVN